MNEAKQTPITDSLASVSHDACQSYEHSSTHHQNIPFGVLAAEALAEIVRLTRERDAAQAESGQLRELLNTYNLGGWTDSERLIKERDALAALVEEAIKGTHGTWGWKQIFDWIDRAKALRAPQTGGENDGQT